MWNGYDLFIWIDDADDVARRGKYLNLVRCLARVPATLTAIGCDCGDGCNRKVEVPEEMGLDRLAQTMAANPGLRCQFIAYADWRVWMPEPQKRPPLVPPPSLPHNCETWEPKHFQARQEQVMQERIAERTVPVGLVQTQSPVYACYNARDDWFMPAKSAGHIYVNFGDDYGTELGRSGRFHPWRNRPEVREKIEANRSQFRAFVEDIIRHVDPAHMVTGADIFAGFDLGYASLVYHRDAYEFGRDLQRYLFLLEDKVRAAAETLPGHPPVHHVHYMDEKMREPEKLVGCKRLNELARTCLRGLQASIARMPADPLMHDDFNLPILSVCRDYPGPWGLFAPDNRQVITDALSEASPEGFRPVGGGWLLMDAGPMAVVDAYERLASAVCA